MKRLFLLILFFILFPVLSNAQQIYGMYGGTQSLTTGSSINCGNGGRIGGHKLTFAPVVGSGGAVNLTSNPQIITSGAQSGDLCYIIGTSDVNTVTINNGNGVILKRSLVLNSTSNYAFVYNGSTWQLASVSNVGVIAGDYASKSITGSDINNNLAGPYLQFNAGSPDVLTVKTTVIKTNFSGGLEYPSASDDNVWEIKVPVTLTIAQIDCWTDSGTVTISFDERSSTTPNTSGTNIMTSNLVCDTDNQSTNSFTNAGISANNYISLSIVSLTGAPASVKFSIVYTKDNL